MVEKSKTEKLSRRNFLRLAGLGTAGTMLAVSGLPALAQDGPSASEGEIIMMYQANEISDDEIAAFNENSDGITLTRIDFDVTRFFAMLASGTAPHLLRTQAPDIPQFFARDIMLNLQPYFDGSSALNMDDLAAANDYYKVFSPTEIGSGDIYGMAKDWAPDSFLWLNKAVFDEAGVSMPEAGTALAPEDLSELAAALTIKDGDQTLQTGFDTVTGFIDRYWQVFIENAGSSLYSEDFSSINLVGNEAAEAVVKFFFDMQMAGSMYSPVNPALNWFGPDFANSQLGIVHTGYWFSGFLRGEAGNPEQPAIAEAMDAGNFQLYPTFTWAGERRNLCITAAGAIVSNPEFREAGDSDNDAAWAVFEWFMSGEPATNRAASGWGLPSLKSLNDLIPGTSGFDQQTLAMVMEELDYANDVVGFNPNLSGGEPMVPGATYLGNLENALNGNISFDELLQIIEDETNFAIEEGSFNL